MALLSKTDNNVPVPFSHEIFLLEICVAGTGYSEKIEEIYPSLKVGEVLKLVRDPHNKHDEYAIAIMYQNDRVGWVPKSMNTVISRLLDAGKTLFFKITDLAEENTPWKHIAGKIYMAD